MNADRLDVVGLGQCSVDYLVRATTFPEADTKCECHDLTVAGGGPVATALVALARWGHRVGFLGVIGDDRAGGEIRASLEEEGVDTRGLLVRSGAASQFAFVVAEPASGRRTIFWQRPTGPEPRSGELDADRLRAARALHSDGLFDEANRAAFRWARDAGVPVVVDAGTLREHSLELAGLADVFLASERFADALVGPGEAEEACRRLAACGPRLVGVTLGERGWVALADGELIRGEAFPVDTVDTTGCGDVFHAGYLHGMLRGWSDQDSLHFGAWAASLVATALGGRTRIPPAEGWPGRC